MKKDRNGMEPKVDSQLDCSVSKTLSDHLVNSEFLRGLVSIRSVDAYLESLHVIIKRFEDARDETEKPND